MTLPRLTGALRAFTNVTAAEESDQSSEIDLVSKKRQRIARRAREGLTWEKLSGQLTSRSTQHKADVTAGLRQVVHLAREIGGFVS